MKSNLEVFIAKFPELYDVLEQLNQNNIDWAIGGSGCLFLLGNERIPDDVDIFLRADQHDLADKVFNIQSFQYTSETERVRNSNPGGAHAMQLTSNLQLTIENKKYDLSLSEKTLAHRIKIQDYFLMPPEEVVLIKLLLQRGPEVGKYDIEDIEKFKAVYKLDNMYLKDRIVELDATERVKQYWK